MGRRKAVSEFYFSVDRKLRMHSWSPELERRAGKSSNGLRGVPYYRIVPRLLTDNGKDAVAKVIEEGKRSILKGVGIVDMDGITGKNILIAPLKSAEDEIVGAEVSFVLRDAARKKERTPLMDYKISSTLAHGMRSPLNSIKGAVVYLKGKYGSDKIFLEFAKIIEEEILRLDNFITKFLSNMDFPDIELSRTDINALLREVEILASFQAAAGNIKTHYVYGKVPPVMADCFQLKHAVLNIVNNALEAMRKGGSLSIKSLTGNCDGRPHVVIEISDTGPGMSRIKTDDWGKSSDHRGRGYGVSITREILQAHGGSMEITSRKGRGTTVRLSIPVSDPGGAHEKR
jgi:two-component system nitrogen regulation sensor histidine kinase GlnL